MPPLADARQSDKELMALYLYNFLLFVDWPEDSCGTTNIINVTIHGDSLIFKALSPMAGTEIRGKTLHLKNSNTLKDLVGPCQVIFISASKQAGLPGILEKIKNRCILTLSDMEGFAQKGGMVYFELPARKPNGKKKGKKFKINLSAIERSGLKIRSRLLRISDIVYDTRPLNNIPAHP